MKRRVRLTEGQLINIVEEASRRVIQEMMNETPIANAIGDGLSWFWNNAPKWYGWMSNKLFGFGGNAQNNGATQSGTPTTAQNTQYEKRLAAGVGGGNSMRGM